MAKITTILDLKILGTEKLVNLEKDIQKTEAALKGLDKTDKKNAKTIAEKRVALKGLRAERNTEQKTMLAVNTQAKKLDGSYNSLVARNKALLTSLKASKGGMKGNTKEIKKMKEEYSKNNEKLKKFDEGLGNNQRNVGNYGSALGNIRDKMAKMGLAVGAAMMVIAALGKAVSLATKDFGEFEKTFTNVLTLMSAGDVENFHAEMQEGALNIITEYGFAISDVNKALFDSVSAGVPAAESVEFMNVASSLALGGVTDLSTAVDGMTTIMNAFQLETSEANKIANAFFTAQKFGKTTVEELSVAIGTVAPHAKRAGMSYQELLAAMAELTKQGIKTDLAATALKSTITAIEKPSEKAKATFDKLGISYGTNAIKSQGLMTILTKITAAGEENADVLTELIPNIRALTGVSAMGTEQLEDYHVILKDVNEDYSESSSLARAVEKQQATLEQSQARLNGEWTKQKILLGEGMKPVFTGFNNSLSFLIENLSTIWSIVKGVAIALVVYNGATIISTIKTGLQTVATWLQVTAQRALNAAMNANPIILLMSLAAGLAVAMASSTKETVILTEAQKKLNEEQEKAKAIASAKKMESDQRNSNMMEEIANLKMLSRTIKDTSKTNEERRKALGDLNKIAGTNITNIANEVSLIKELDLAYENAVNSIKAKYVMQAAESEILTLIEKEYELGGKQQALVEKRTTNQEKINTLLDEQVAIQNETNKVNADENKTYDEKREQQRVLTNHMQKVYVLRKDNLESIREHNGIAKQGTEIQAEQNAIYEKAQKIVDKFNIKKKRKITLDGADQSLHQQMKSNVKEANDELHKQIALGNDTTAALKNLTDVKKILNDHEKDFKDLTEEDTVATETNVEALDKKIKTNQKYIDSIKGINVAESEYNNAHIKQLKDKIALIMLQTRATGTLTTVQQENLAQLKKSLGDFENSLKDEDTGMSPLQKAFYGEGVQEAFSMAGSALDILGSMQDGRNQLATVEFDNEMYRLNTTKNTELANFDKSARAEKMSSEDKAKARENIAKKHDTVITALKIKEFDRNKKLELSEAKMSGALSIMRIWSGQITSNPVIDAIIKGFLVVAQISRTNQQIKAINKTEFKGAKGGIIPQFANGGMVNGNSHANGGVKFNVGGTVAELEGGEAVINKRSTAMFRNQLSDMNVAGGGKKFADGGLVLGALAKAQTRSLLTEDDIVGIASALSAQQVTVTESDITGTQQTISVLESRATF